MRPATAPLIAATALLLLSAPGGAQDDAPPDELEVADALARIAHAGDLDIVVDPGFEARVDLRLLDLPPREALDVLARRTGAEVEELAAGILFVSQPRRVTARFVDADVREVVRHIAAQAGENVLLAPVVRGRVTVDLEETPWLAALDSVARAAGFVVVELAPGLRVVRDVPAAPGTPTPKPAVSLHGARVTLDVTDAPLEDVVAGLAIEVGRDLLVEPEVLARVTLRLTDVPYRAALVALARLAHCRMEEEGGVVVLLRPPAVAYQAAGAPAGVWFRLLARRADADLAAGELTGTVECDLQGVPPEDVLLHTARVSGFDARGGERGEPLQIPAGAALPVAGDERLSAALREVERLARAGDPAALEPSLADLVRVMRGDGAPPTSATAPARPISRETLARIDEVLSRPPDPTDWLADELNRTSAALKDIIVVDGGPAVIAAARERAAQLGLLEGKRRLVVALGLDIAEGNYHLRAMAEAIREERLAAVAPGFAALEALAARMRTEEREIFHRNAEAFLSRGRSLVTRSEQAARASRFPLAVTATITDDGPEGLDQAIVNGHVVAEGELALDATGAEIAEVRVVKILPGAVRFAFEDDELTKELKR